MKRWLCVFAIGCVALLSRQADAEIYPTRPITIVIGFAAGAALTSSRGRSPIALRWRSSKAW
jgi:hypothetical protein